MSPFKAKSGKPPYDSSRKIKVHQRYLFARANQSTNNLVDRGANGGLAGGDMRILQKTDKKINIAGIDDHELTSMDVVTPAALFDTQKGPVLGFFMNMLTLISEDLFMDRWNGSTARLMTDPKLLEVPRELKPLVEICFHFPLNPVWFTCSPPGFLLMLIFNNIPMSFSHHLTFGMLLFWTMVLHLPFLSKFTKKLMILCSKILCLMNLGIFTNEWYITWMDSIPTESVEHTFHDHLHQTNPAEVNWKSVRPYFGWLNKLGRFDIHAHAANMSRFRAPKKGYMYRLERMPLGPRIMLLGPELINLTIHSYQNMILIGNNQFISVSLRLLVIQLSHIHTNIHLNIELTN